MHVIREVVGAVCAGTQKINHHGATGVLNFQLTLGAGYVYAKMRSNSGTFWYAQCGFDASFWTWPRIKTSRGGTIC